MCFPITCTADTCTIFLINEFSSEYLHKRENDTLRNTYPTFGSTLSVSVARGSGTNAMEGSGHGGSISKYEQIAACKFLEVKKMCYESCPISSQSNNERNTFLIN